MRNLMLKSRKPDQPYLIYESDGWTWRVLKSWQGDNRKPYARWLCDVTSPYARETGDVYVADIVSNARLTFVDPDLADAIVATFGGGTDAV